MNKREVRAMKELLTDLGKDAARLIKRRPAPAEEVMRAFCDALQIRTGRPIDLVLRAFPPDVPVSGLRLDLGERSMIVVEEDTAVEAQLVILGHELYHDANGDCHHVSAGLPTAARALTEEPDDDVIQRCAEAILASRDVPLEAVRAVAARSESVAAHEESAESFGLLFGVEVRTWVEGLPQAQSPTTAATVEGRLALSLGRRSGLLR
ncbi:toxin [Streptomyces sp. 039-1]|uniref:toxin n=1 Tax=Streptomyces sp. 039-1 TaxID=2789263 RepID=UPI0039F64742